MSDTPLAISVESGQLWLRRDEPVSARLRLYLRNVLGAVQQGTNWNVPLRNLALDDVISQLADQLERQGVGYTVEGVADEALRAEQERRRSFQRTIAAGKEFKAGRPAHSAVEIETRLAAAGWNMAERTLRPHQVAAVSHALTVVNAANFSVPGAGKTATSLAIFAMHRMADTVDLAVVVGPLASFAPWETESAIAWPGGTRPRRVRGVNALARASYYRQAEPGDLLLLTYPTVPADLHELRRLARRLRVMLIVDESHRVKRFAGGLWAPAIMSLAESSRVRLILSGTPMPQGPLDMYSQLNVLWPKGELTGSRATYRARVTANFPAVVNSISPVYVRTAKSDLGIPPYTVDYHNALMPPLQDEIYDLIVGHFQRQLEDADTYRDKLEVLRRARPLRLLQAAANPDLLNSTDGFFRLPPLADAGGTLMNRLAQYREHEVPGKFQMTLDLLADQVQQGRKVVVWTSFIKNVDQVRDLIRRLLGVPVFAVDGRVPVEADGAGNVSVDDPGEEVDLTRERRIARFLSTEEPAVMVANPAACGESISLHKSCHTAIYVDRTYDCARYLQSIDRIHRLGLPPDANVQIHVVKAVRADGAGAVDDLVDLSLIVKRDRMEELLQGGELVPGLLEGPSSDDPGGNRQDLDQLLRYLLGE